MQTKLHNPKHTNHSIKLKALHNYDYRQESDKFSLICPEVSKTVQAHKEECDINVIAYRFGLGHPVPQALRLPSYGDFDDVSDFHSAMQAIRQSKESFMQLPANVRERFANDPGQFVAFCSDSGNRQEAIKLGLIPKQPDPAAPPQTAPIAVPEPTPSK